MLNELLQVARGARDAGIAMTSRHSDIKDARRIPTLLVSLDQEGGVARVRPVPRTVTPWTMRDGQHNSFPFVQPKSPLWKYDQMGTEERPAKKDGDRRRGWLLSCSRLALFNVDEYHGWPGAGLIDRLKERRQQLASLAGSDGERMLITIDRFIAGCSKDGGLLSNIQLQLIENLRETPEQDWVDVAETLLVGDFDRKVGQYKCAGGLLFEAALGDRKKLSVIDSKMATLVSDVLRAAGSNPGGTIGACALRGHRAKLVSGPFPQPNLPVLGQSFLFAKNRDIPANERYGQLASEAMPVGGETILELSAAFTALTSPERKGITWRPLPGEAPKQRDLMVAFVAEVPNAPVAAALADENDGAEGDNDAGLNPVARYETHTKRLIATVKATIGAEFHKAPIQVAIFRKVDPANRKVICAGAPTVGDLLRAATAWIEGEQNTPEWVALPVPVKGERQLRSMRPPHIAPLGLIALSKQVFLRNGTHHEEVSGIPASEALQLFLEPSPVGTGNAFRRIKRVLRLVLSRRANLLIPVAQLLHAPGRWEHRAERLKKYDRREALSTITVLGILLHKLGRSKETYMNGTGFRLGQLLAAADIVHAGYCSDVRGGDIPPALLGNQVFAMARSAPVKAINVLCRRWKPYHAWASRENRSPERATAFVDSGRPEEVKRGWDIRTAIRHWREMEPLAEELRHLLQQCKVDDGYRAELLLGYVAGLGPAKKSDSNP